MTAPDSPGSITYWINECKKGGPGADEARAQLWRKYMPRLVGLAKKKLCGARPGVADAEGVADSAFAAFCRGVEAGQFPEFADRDGLWRLLAAITVRRALKLLERENARKRGRGQVVLDEAALQGPDDSSAAPGLAAVLSREPTPDDAAAIADEIERLQALLTERQRAIVGLMLEGCTQAAMATRLECSLSTIEREVKNIRETWEQGIDP